MALNNIIKSVGGILGLNDPNTECVQTASDRVTVGGSVGFTTVDQGSISTAVSGGLQRELLRSAVDVSGTKETQGEKFFYLGSYTWTNSKNYLDEVFNMEVVKFLQKSDHAVAGLLAFHKYGRFGLDLIIQINPTQFQQGGLIVALIPGAIGFSSMAAYPIYPHVKLNCNVNNMGRIQVPFVYTRGMFDFHAPLYQPWHLHCRVLSPLRGGGGSSSTTNCTVNVLGRFVDLELHGLTPLVAVHDLYSQMMRNEFRISTTANVANLANYQDSRAKISLAVDQERDLPEPGVAGELEVHNFRTWTEVPTIITHFAYNESAQAGKRIFTIPVSPYWFHTAITSYSEPHPSALASICQMFSYWRGDLVYHFEVFPTRFHSGRLLFVFVPGNEDTDVSTVTMLKATNGLCALMDINGVASTLVFRVPYVSDTPYRVNTHTSSNRQAGEYEAIGKICVFAYSKLERPSMTEPHVDVAVYISAENLDLVGPLYWPVSNSNDSGQVSLFQSQAGDETGYTTAPEVQQHDCKQEAPQQMESVKEVPKGAVTSIEDPLLAMKKPETFQELEPGVLRHTSDQMDMRTYMGRAHYFTQFTFKKDQHVYTFPLDLNVLATDVAKAYPGTLRWFFSLFQLYRGPLDLTIVISGAADVDGVLWFTPKGIATTKNWEEVDSSLYAAWKAALGVVRFNTSRTGNIQVRIPFYTDTPAVSANLPDAFQTDTRLGSVSIQVMNYTSADEYVSFALYISMTEDSHFYFPRAPFTNSRIQQAQVQSEADVEEDDESRAFSQYRSCVVEEYPYKPLRMEVAKWRLAYAHEELHKPVVEIKKEKKKKAGISRAICKSMGDLFSQGVTPKEDGDMVCKVSGTITLHGFYYGGKVYYADCVPRAARFVPLFNYGRFLECDDDDTWMKKDRKVDVRICRIWSGVDFTDVWFNFKNYMEKKDIMKPEDMANLDDKTAGVLTHVLGIIRPSHTTMVDHLLVDSVVATDVKTDVKQLVGECSAFMNNVQESMRKFTQSMSGKKSRIVCKSLLGLIKTAIGLYVCHRSGWDVKTVIPIAISVGLDCITFGCDLKEAITEAIVESVGVGTDDGELRSESGTWLREIVAGIVVFKAARDALCWLVEKLQRWYEKRCGIEKMNLEALRDNEDRIDKLVSVCDAFCVEQIQDQSKHDAWQRGVELLAKLRTLQILIRNCTELQRMEHLVRDSVSRVHNKVKSLGVVNEDAVVRPEPVVIYLCGERGSGKSLMAMCLAVKICSVLGLDYNKNIYTKAIASDYWDGYSSQQVCIIDDIGQRSDDSDWLDFCQLVSGCPMRLNMAALEEKGRHFVSPIIICTSNLENPSPRTVYVHEAVLRRLHHKYVVRPKTAYERKQPGVDSRVGVLDVMKARADNTIKDMSCLLITECNTGAQFTVDELVDLAVATVAIRKSNMNEFVDLWSQQENDFSNELRLLLNTQEGIEPTGRVYKIMSAVREHPVLTTTMVLGLAGLVAAAVAAFYACKKLMKNSTQLDSKRAYNATPRPNAIVKLHQRDVESMSVLEVSNLIRKNLVRFGTGESDEQVSWTLNGLGIRDDWILVPSHAFKFDKEERDYFFLEKNNTFYCTTKEKVEVVTLDVGFADVVLMRFPGIPPFRDITGHFVKKEDLSKCDRKLATLCTMNGGIFQMIAEGKVVLEDSIDYQHKTLDGDEVTLHVTSIWRGKGEAGPGTCGGALVSSNNKLQNPIIGIHVAGGKSGLVSKVVYREMFDIIDKRHMLSQRITRCEFSTQRLHTSSQTRFVKSDVHEQVVAKHDVNLPAAMPYGKGPEIDPIQVMLSKYDRPIVEEPVDYVVASIHVACKLRPFVDEVNQRFLSVIEAIEGIDGMEHIDMNTSPGLPYVLHGLKKRDLICEVTPGVEYVFHPMLMSNWSMMINNFTRGMESDCVFATAAKDELRKPSKVLESETRAIEAAPLHFTLVVRQAWGCVIGALQSNPGWHTGIGVGLDAEADWDALMRSALQFGDEGIDLDFRAFDASLSPFMLRQAGVVMTTLAGLDHYTGRAIMNTITYSRHMIGNMIFTVNGSMPSGTPCTSLLNSIINLTNLYYVFGKIFGVTYAEIEECVRMICYGDDVMIVLKRGCVETRGLCKKLQIELNKLGLEVTGADKGPVRCAPLLALTFLKRHTIMSAGRFFPSMDERTIWSMLAWRRKEESFEANVRNALWFAFVSGDDKGRALHTWLTEVRSLLRLDFKIDPVAYFLVRKRELPRGRVCWEEKNWNFEV